MFKINRIIAAFLAASLLLISGCSEEKADSNEKNDTKNDASSVSESNSDNESSEDEQLQAGEYLTKTAEMLNKGEYTMRCTVSSNAYDGETKIIRVVSGDNVYQLQSENAGSYGIISVDGDTYDFDNATGIYQKTEQIPPKSIVEEVIERNLPKVNDIEESSDDDMIIEQYTYTGDTYITNILFYFDKHSGELSKYILKYTIEGQDDITETRVIDLLIGEADESVFDLGFLEGMSDFGEMTEDEKYDFCMRMTKIFGVTFEDMQRMGIKENDFKQIDFYTFLNLIYSV